MKSLFVPPHDYVLSQIAKHVQKDEIQLPETKHIIEQMLSVAYGEQTDRKKPVLVGLAAPQIGISKRIILVDIAANGKGDVGDLRIYINPEIVWQSNEKEEWYEGCYSTDRVCGIVARPKKIKLTALTRFDRHSGERSDSRIKGDPEQTWNITEEEYEGYTARIFQHEVDHLNGKEFVTHISDPDKLHWVEEHEFPQYRDNEAWRNWKKKCTREKWEKIKKTNS